MSLLSRVFSDLLTSQNRDTRGGKDMSTPKEEKTGPSVRDRYLQLLMDSLLNEIYLENEVRFLYIFSMLATGKPVDGDVVRQISLRLPDWVESVRAARQEGRIWWRLDVQAGELAKKIDLRNVCQFSHTMIGRKRLDNILYCLDIIRGDGLKGDLAETGA
jgi:hypothetical protein